MKLLPYVFKIIASFIGLMLQNLFYEIRAMFPKKKHTPQGKTLIATEQEIVDFLIEHGTKNNIHKEAFLYYIQSNYSKTLRFDFMIKSGKELLNNGVNGILIQANKQYEEAYDKVHK